MPDLIVDRLPDLHNPVAVVAFEGWNDAASAATDAARYLVNRLGGRRFASIDAERFYSFTDARPMVSILPGNVRRIGWQKNEFYYVRNPSGPHDIVIGVGVEPNLRWRSFAGAHAELYNNIAVEYVVSLGALLADVPHTRPTRVTGSAFDPQVAERLSLTTSRYEGPTGIVGVLHDSLRQRGVDAASLWANTPHYISASKNPDATRALLVRLQELVGLRIDMKELETSSKRFLTEVEQAIAANPEIAAYVSRLETAYDAEPEAEESSEDPVELPAPDEAVLDVEEFLRRQRDD
ncbi:MAG: PAC2 family protein [Dehalococcoidia bacterium]